jgi:hypothetical protein
MRDLFPKVIGVESITDFGQDDADCYTLDVTTEDGEIVLVMGTFEAVRLHNLLVKKMGEYVANMNEARASYERGEGPNGEPRGTWERRCVHCGGTPGQYEFCSNGGLVGPHSYQDVDAADVLLARADLYNKARKENA